MAMNVVGLFDTRDDAQNAIQQLRDAGFSGADISFLASNANGAYDTDASSTHDSEAAEGAGMGATGGAVLGGLAGLLVGLGALVIPGIGPAVAAGTLATALGSAALGAGIGAAAGGLVGALVGAGIPEEESHVYAEGVRRGGALASVLVQTDEEADRAADIMNANNVVDIDRRGAEYRQSGWSRFDENAEPYSATSASTTGDADRVPDGSDYERSSKVGTAGGAVAGAATGAAIGSAGGPVGTVIGGIAGAVTGGGVGAAGDAAGVEATDADSTTTGASTSYDSTTTGASTSYDTTTTGVDRTTLDQSGEVKLPVVEEELRVGKRQVERGGVRVFTRVEEVPVNEQVTLREETVDVHRRPVDRAVTDADIANFQEGTFEVRERDEEAVVDKQARVVEEVHIKKEAEERTETISDTVRRTDVDVEEIPGGTRASTTETVGRIGTQGVTGTDATTGATTAGDEGVIERNASRLGNTAEGLTGADLDRDGDVGQRDPRNNY